jgi:hypothetical protein
MKSTSIPHRWDYRIQLLSREVAFGEVTAPRYLDQILGSSIAIATSSQGSAEQARPAGVVQFVGVLVPQRDDG